MNLKFNIHIAKHGHTIVNIDDFEIPSHRLTFLFGESGIGKTILSKAILGLLDPANLNIQINNQDYDAYLQEAYTRFIRENGFFVFQEPSTHLNPLLSLTEQLQEGSLKNAPQEKEILQHLWDTSNDAGIRKILSVYPKPHRPSGGEKQRILLAMAIKKINYMFANEKAISQSLFIFDEPTGNLDNHFRNLFLQLLMEKFAKFPFTSLFITHDYSIISEVYNKHQGHLNKIAFKELSLQNGKLRLQNFAPTAYLNWLKAEKPVHFTSNARRKPVLRLSGGYEVFGNKMILSNHKNSKSHGELQLRPGEMVYLKAASGVGKTTLAKIIMGIQFCRNLNLIIGRYKFTEHTPKAAWQREVWGKRIGMIFQHADEALNQNATVKEVFGGLPGHSNMTMSYLIDRLNELFDFPITEAFLKKKVALLSGGQKQRLNLLRTLILDTDIVILDEPLNGLDFISIKKVIDKLQQKQKEGKAILMVSHNEEIFDAIIPPENVYYLSIA